MKILDGEYLASKLAAKCVEDGDCLIWQGAMNDRGPVLTFDRKQYSVRALVWMQRNGPIPDGKVMSVECGRRRCLEHVQATTRSVLCVRSNLVNPQHRAAQIAKAKRAGSRLSQEAVQAIVMDDRHISIVAAEHGISEGYAYMLKRGQFRRDYSSPFIGLFTQLGARS